LEKVAAICNRKNKDSGLTQRYYSLIFESPAVSGFFMGAADSNPPVFSTVANRVTPVLPIISIKN